MPRVAAFILCLFMALPVAWAQGAAPTKDSLRAAWERAQAENENVVMFEKTKEENVYDFETTTFPYAGKLRVLNLLVDKQPHAGAPLYSGVVEVELEGVDDDFYRKHSYSYYAWAKTNRFYYDADSGEWFMQDAWQDHYAAAAAENTARPCVWNTHRGIIFLLAALGLGLVLVLGRAARGQHKKAWAAQDVMMERQKRVLEATEENLALQREQVELLKELVGEIRKG